MGPSLCSDGSGGNPGNQHGGPQSVVDKGGGIGLGCGARLAGTREKMGLLAFEPGDFYNPQYLWEHLLTSGVDRGAKLWRLRFCCNLAEAGCAGTKAATRVSNRCEPVIRSRRNFGKTTDHEEF